VFFRGLSDLIYLYIVILMVRIVLTWFPTTPWSPLARATRVLSRVTDPVLAPVRRRLPAAHLGGAAIDLSPLVVFFALAVVLSILPR
jgi:YggT family protein